jgi:hypothetical protein
MEIWFQQRRESGEELSESSKCRDGIAEIGIGLTGIPLVVRPEEEVVSRLLEEQFVLPYAFAEGCNCQMTDRGDPVGVDRVHPVQVDEDGGKEFLLGSVKSL